MARNAGGKQNLNQILADVNRDIRALNSSILIISQKMKHLARNEKILGRNLIVVNTKIAELRKQVKSRPVGEEGVLPQPTVIAAEVPADLQETLSQLQSKLDAVKDSVDEVSANYVSQAEFKEVKYIVDAIDPLKFATIEQLQAVSGKKVKASKPKARKKPAKKKKKKK
jgi:hypothetical protein